MNKFFGHLKTVNSHRRLVRKLCFKCGLYWQGFKHDLSKFSFIEFFESVKYYKGTSSPIDACKKLKGYSKAWQHHKGRNLHHHEYWTDNYDSGTTTIEMPYKYAVEMFCDYCGAARAYLGKDFSWKKEIIWWDKKRLSAAMNKNTKNFISECFLFCEREQHFPNKKQIKTLYNQTKKY